MTTTAVRARRWDPTAFGLAVFAGVAVVLWVVANVSAAWLPTDPVIRQVDVAFVGDGIAGMWAHFDAGWYFAIASDGYAFVSVDQQATVAFFPLYPLAMRAVGMALGGNPLLGGVLITLAAGAGSVVLFVRWCADRMAAPAVRWAVVALLVYPYALYLYGAVYADALFLVAALGAFVLAERGHPVLAGLAGAAATATRPVGLAVVAGLVVLVWAKRRSWRRLRPADAGVLLSLGGLGAWMGYLGARFGDPLLSSKIQAAWGQQSGVRTWFKLDLVDRWRAVPCHTRGWLGFDAPTCGTDYGTDLLYTLGATAQGVLLVAGLVAVPWIVRRFGWAYGVYTAAVLAPALLGSQDFHGAGRYLLAAFPVFALVGTLLATRPRTGRVVLAVSALLLVALTSLFAREYYVA
jgi:hypothetical protein